MNLKLSELKILVVDDDISFSTEVLMKLECLGFRNVSNVYTLTDAFSSIDSVTPELVLLDIRLNATSNETELAKYLHLRRIPFIIMTQFRDEDLYLELSRFMPLAYFTKPLDYVALRFAIEEYFEFHDHFRSKEELIKDQRSCFLYVRKGNKYLKVRFEDLLFLNAEGNYLTLWTSGAKFIVRSSLKKALKILPSRLFFQVHRNFLVNNQYIDEYDSEKSKLLIQNTSIPVGRSYRQEVKKQLNLFH